MSRIWRAVCFAMMVGGLIVGPTMAQEALFTPREEPAADCLAQKLMKTVSEEYPVCGSCSGQCHSDGACRGKQAGDLCSNQGDVCQITGGCGLFDCCRCLSPLQALLAAEPAARR